MKTDLFYKGGFSFGDVQSNGWKFFKGKFKSPLFKGVQFDTWDESGITPIRINWTQILFIEFHPLCIKNYWENNLATRIVEKNIIMRG